MMALKPEPILHRWPLFIALSFGLVFSVIALSVTLLHAYNEEHEDAEDFLLQLENIGHNAHRTLTELQALGTPNCSPANLLAMRSILFGQSYARDIRHRSGASQRCSAVLGPIEQAVEPPPELITQKGLVLRKEYPPNHYGREFLGYSIGNQHYDLIYHSGVADAFVPAQKSYELLYIATDNFVHIAGKRGLYTGRVNSVLDWRWGSGQRVEICSTRSQICVVTQRRFENWIEHSLADFLLILLASVGLSVFVYWERSCARRKHRSVKSRVARGLVDCAFYAQYQPIVKMDSQDIIGCEILARFEDEYGAIYPDEFIPIIQELAQTWSFSEQLLNRSLRELSLQTALPAGFRVSFNLFPCDVSSGAVNAIENMACVQNSRFSLVFEITEDQLLDEEQARPNLYRLQQQGQLIAIDDFGKGYSNLKQIQKLHCHILKIDRSFVMDLEVGAIRASLIPNIIEIAHKTDLKLVAEGIENEQQYQILLDWGVEFGQGWLFGKPQSPERLTQTLNRQKTSS